MAIVVTPATLDIIVQPQPVTAGSAAVIASIVVMPIAAVHIQATNTLPESV